MKKSIWLNKTDKFLLACDGKKFYVYGDSSIAKSIRKHAKRSRGESPFADMLSDADDDADPVAYWYESAQGFVFEEPPFAFSDEALKNAQKELAELRKVKRNEKSMLSKKIRYDALRLSLVDAIMTSSECSGITFCTSTDCCSYLCRIAPRFGLIINKDHGSDDYSDRCLKYENPKLVSKKAAEALECLSFQHETKRYCDECSAYDLLVEILPDVPRIVWDEFQFVSFEDSDAPKSRRDALKRQIAYVLVSLAFPDSYLDHFADRVNTEIK